MKRHLDDYLLIAGICALAYGIELWRMPEAWLVHVFLIGGVGLIGASLVTGLAMRR